MIPSADVLAVSAVMVPFVIGFFVWIVKKLYQHDSALAVLIEEVKPPGRMSLRELLAELKLETVKAQASNTRVIVNNGET
jgi:hypothetical protein